MSLNKCMIIGNLGRDPEMRYTPSGQAVTQFTVATNRNYRDQNQEWQKETEWFRVVVWGQQAERAAENLRKGHKVYIEGRIQTRQWEDQTGQKRTPPSWSPTRSPRSSVASAVTRTRPSPTRRPRRLRPLGRRASGGRRPAAASGGQPRRPAAAASHRDSGDDFDDLPF